MDFIKAVRIEYLHILAKTTICTPIVEPFYGNRKILLLVVLPYFGLIFYGFPDRVDTIYSIIITLIAMPIVFVVILIAIHIILSITILFPGYIFEHRKFVQEIKRMSFDEQEQVLSEYQKAKKVDLYYDKKKKVSGTQSILVSESRLFVPGFFILQRESVQKVFIDGPSRSKEPVCGKHK